MGIYEFVEYVSEGATLASSAFWSAFFLLLGLQLLMFMHMIESSNGRIQVGHILFSAFVAIVIALGSYWVMEFGIHLEHYM